jgi:hypothetical protein
MCTVDLVPLVSTAVGAAVALLGTIVADLLRGRGERDRTSRRDRRKSYLAYVVALDAAHTQLREVADPNHVPQDPRREANQAVTRSRVYENRERLLMSGTPAVLTAGERALVALAKMRRVVGDGFKRQTPEFHDAYHEFAGNLWRLRRAIREDLGASDLSPSDLDKPSWDSRETCTFCQQRLQAPAPAGNLS